MQSVENTEFSSKPPDFLGQGNQGVTDGSANQEGDPSTLKNETAAQAGPLNGGKIGNQSCTLHAHLSSASTAATTDEVAVRWRIGDTFREKAAGRIHTYRLVAIKPHTTRTGHQSAVLYWSGRCAACGGQMVALSGKTPRELVRTCLEHRGKWKWAAAAEGAANG